MKYVDFSYNPSLQHAQEVMSMFRPAVNTESGIRMFEKSIEGVSDMLEGVDVTVIDERKLPCDLPWLASVIDMTTGPSVCICVNAARIMSDSPTGGWQNLKSIIAHELVHYHQSKTQESFILGRNLMYGGKATPFDMIEEWTREFSLSDFSVKSITEYLKRCPWEVDAYAEQLKYTHDESAMSANHRVAISQLKVG